MELKKIKLLVAIFLIAFAIISIVKYLGHSGKNGLPTKAAKSDTKQMFWAHYNHATDYRMHGQVDSSIIAYLEALKMNPKHEDALYYIGNMYMKSDQFDNAIEKWEKLIELNPQSERAYNQLGNLYFSFNHPAYFHPEKSKEYYKQAAILNNITLNPNLCLGEIALFQNRIKEALDIFNKISMMDQKNVRIFFLLGYLNWKSGKVQNAIKNLEQSFKLGLTATLMNEQGEAAIVAKNKSSSKTPESDLFMDWLIRNFKVPEKYDIKMEMPKVYQTFDQYLLKVREQLNHT